jgi:multidrug efflux pump subunit AcrA (membrane-fusion protein)
MESDQSQSRHSTTRASSRAVTVIVVLLACVFGVIFIVGYLPRRERAKQTVAAARREARSLPVVLVADARQADKTVSLMLPGNIQAVTETPILARAEGYLIKRTADIGDRVKAGQELAELATPELDQQVEQAKATVQQTRAALTQARANLSQAKANSNLAEVTAKRNSTLVTRGVLSKQEGDQSTANYQAQLAQVQAAEATISAAQQNVNAAEANLQRLTEMQSFKIIRAPFDGIITLRNIDTGTLINTGSTLLFRIAQTNVLRIFINVPQANYNDLHVGAIADINVQELPGRKFIGKITRISGALDTNTRTMLTEVQIRNSDNSLLPGMYAQVTLSVTRSHPPVIVPGDAVVVQNKGTVAAVVDDRNRVHFQPINIGRDYGSVVEVSSGLKPGDKVVINPGDQVHEGVRVKTEPFRQTTPGANKNTGKASV